MPKPKWRKHYLNQLIILWGMTPYDIFMGFAAMILLCVAFHIVWLIYKVLTVLYEVIITENGLIRIINEVFGLEQKGKQIPEMPENSTAVGPTQSAEFLSDMDEEEYEDAVQPVWYKRLFRSRKNR